MIDKTLLDKMIIGRVEPHIYAFTTNTVPNYLKIGDTFRPVSVRLNEWKEHYPNLEKKFEETAKINDDVYFRDYAVHQYLENDKKFKRLSECDISSDLYYSKEFFKDATPKDIEEAIENIKEEYEIKSLKYKFYSALTRLAQTVTFSRVDDYDPRPNQDETIKNFNKAYADGRNNLLMYAVMRFGKSFTSMCCALEMGAKVVLIVSAKADVKMEWKKTIESHKKFYEFIFLTSYDLKNESIIDNTLKSGKKVAIFLTLQDLQGTKIKEKHKELFKSQIDLLLIDETHFGARAEKYGQVLKQPREEKDIKYKKDLDDFVDTKDAEYQLKNLNAKMRIHLSGTPYRILMGSEFSRDDIIAFYQFADIAKDQNEWIIKNNLKPESEQKEDWENPYYGFPQMIRFAFNPNKSSRAKLSQLKDNGIAYAFSALLKPKSITKDDDGNHKKFLFENEILELFEVIDGSKNDDELLGFLDYDKIKDGKMCRHIVIVLPYCASCDALEALIKNNKDKFKNINKYEIINISGVDNENLYKTPLEIKKAISTYENEGKKTITLTVNRMLTGSTVPEWDTMLYLKDTSSPQEYDQAIFRLQNQYIKTFETEEKSTIKFNMKPQTLLVDFMPNRMFLMQEQKAQIYNVNIEEAGNSKLKERLEKELEISPIVTINSSKITQVSATDILKVVSDYNNDRGIKDEALEIPVDLNVLNNPDIKAIIEKENEIGSKSGLSVSAHEKNDEGDNIDVPDPTGKKENTDDGSSSSSTSEENDENISLRKKIQSYYTRILLYSFLTDDIVISLEDITDSLKSNENLRISTNLGLEQKTLKLFYDYYYNNNKWALRDLDYKIQNLNGLSHSDITPEEKANIAINKFGKLGEAIVITPMNIVNHMINLIPDDKFGKENKILDIASVTGEFAISICNKMKSLNLSKEIISNSIYSIAKSSLCYELTRKVYSLLELNIDNILSFYADEFSDVKKDDEIDYEKLSNILLQNKKYKDIKLDDNIEGGIDMIKFSAVVGNPPYQETIKEATEGNNKNTVDIYQIFQELSLKIGDMTCLIYPAKEFQRGKSTLMNKHLKYLRIYNGSSREGEKHIPNEESVFGDTVRRIPGDVGLVVYDNLNEYENIIYQDCEISRTDKILPVRKDLLSISKKLLPHVNSFKISEIAKVCESNYVEHNKSNILDKQVIRGEKSPEGYSKVLTNDKAGSGGKAKWYYIKTDKLDKLPVEKYKIVIASARPNESFANPSNMEILSCDESFGRTKKCLYDSDDYSKICNCKKYLSSKFSLCVNAMTPDKFLYYLPDYDYVYDKIDWIRDLTEIDEQLFSLFGLSNEEKEYIKNNF